LERTGERAGDRPVHNAAASEDSQHGQNGQNGQHGPAAVVAQARDDAGDDDPGPS
jgi:hypothetical protein